MTVESGESNTVNDLISASPKSKIFQISAPPKSKIFEVSDPFQ